jgi:hypothetical protein
MKNLFIASALMLSLATFAQTPTQPTNTQTTTAQPATTATQAPATATQAPAQAASTDQSMAANQDEKTFKKITQSEIAPSVLKPAVAKYEGFSLVEAMVAEDGTQYKLVLTKDGKDVAAYFKSNGEFIKEVAA